MKVSVLYITKRLKELSLLKRKEYTLDNSISAYHLMCGTKFIVIDESLDIINIVVSALMRDKRK